MDTNKIKVQRAHSTLLMFGIFSIVMLFAGLTSAYIVSKGSLGSSWDVIKLPTIFLISTLLIFGSTFSAWLAIKECIKDNVVVFKKWLLLTIILGFGFGICQFFGWTQLVNEGKYLSGNNVSASYIYVLTVTHLVHVLGGVIALLVIYFRALSNHYSGNNFHSVKLAIRFWHFLSFLWLYLFLFLSFLM